MSTRRGNALAVVVAGVAVAAAGTTATRAGGVTGSAGAMGLDLVQFTLMWTLMMMAMMLPSLAPVAALYLRSLPTYQWAGGAGFVTGYALLWAGAGAPAFELALVVDRVIDAGNWAPRTFAALALGVCASYHWLPVRYRMLWRCRNPLGLVIQYSARRGRVRHLAAGVHYGLTCLACCWALMAVLFVFGTMNLLAMAVIAGIVMVEKTWSRGVGFARLVGIVAAGLAVAVLFVPELATGLVAGHTRGTHG